MSLDFNDAKSANAPALHLRVKHSTSAPPQLNHCFHCGEPCLTELLADDHSFCCRGCVGVYRFIHTQGLSDYYKLRQEERPAAPPNDNSQTHWQALDALPLSDLGGRMDGD